MNQFTTTTPQGIELALDADGLDGLSEQLARSTEQIDWELCFRHAMRNTNLKALLILMKHFGRPTPSYVITFLARFLMSGGSNEEDIHLLRELFDLVNLGCSA